MTSQPFDPFAMWRDMLTKWESGVNEAANLNMASPEFSRYMNQAMGMSMRVRQGVGEVMARYLETMNMPSRTEVVALGERLHGIEEQLSRLNMIVERLALAEAGASAAPAIGPPRTKRPKALNGDVAHATPVQAVAAVSAAPEAKKRSKPPRRAKRAKPQ